MPLYPILLHSTSLCVIVTSHHFSLPFLFMPSAMSSLDDLSVSVPASVTSLPYFFDPTNLSPLPLPSPLCSGGSYGDGRRDPHGPQRRSVSLPPPPFLPTFHFVLLPSSPPPLSFRSAASFHNRTFFTICCRQMFFDSLNSFSIQLMLPLRVILLFSTLLPTPLLCYTFPCVV